MRRLLRVVGSFFDDHPIVRRWVFPIVFMGALLLPMFALRYTTVQAAQLTAVFLAFSTVAIVVGIILEKVIEFTAGELL